MPYVSGGTVYWTTYNYDALGRTVSVVLPNGAGTTTYLYEGNTVKVTDPAGKWKKFTMDGMGNLTKVTEPNPAGGEWDTNYSYNAANMLTQVSMPRGTATQVRTFNYDASFLLTSATNPETGTVSYVYDWARRLSLKTDAKGQKTEYLYDGHGRLTTIQRYNAGSSTPDPNQTVNYYYDTNPFDGTFTQNAQGRLAAVRTKGFSGLITFTEMFSYTAAGNVTKKRLDYQYQNDPAATLQSNYTYDNEGARTSMTYPSSHDGNLQPQPGRTFTYSYDAMHRLSGMTEQGTQTSWVSGVSYNAAGQMTQMTGPAGVETRQYNVLGQLTRITVPGVVDFEYVFSGTANNGRITRAKDYITGEDVDYAYDALNRLISAVTTGPEYGLTFTYDGFGNKTGQALTKGSGPVHSFAVDGATNRIVGMSYDANGNMYTGASTVFDVGNRLVTQNNEYYGYLADNKRVYKRKGPPNVAAPPAEVYYYDVTGQRIGTYEVRIDGYPVQTYLVKKKEEFYFGGKLVRSGDEAVVADRLGSVRYRKNVTTQAVERTNYYPYGEERPGATAQERDKFGTYYRDATGFDYADQRYYGSQWGRFMSADPYEASARISNPISWNRYLYVNGDPVNFIDPSGLAACPANYQTSVTYNGVTYVTTTIYICNYIPGVQYLEVLGSSGWNMKTHSTQYIGNQAEYESGFCSTSYGLACYEEQRVRAQLIDALQTLFDVGGLVPGYGEVLDFANALIYAARGDGANAVLSLASMFPIGGQIAGGLRIGSRGLEAIFKLENRYFAKFLQAIEGAAARAGRAELGAAETRNILDEALNRGWRVVSDGVETKWMGGRHIHLISPDGNRIHFPVPDDFIP
jgi:RHS repeat-associated protein